MGRRLGQLRARWLRAGLICELSESISYGLVSVTSGAESVAAIVVLGIIGTGFAYVLNYQIITSEGATVASTVTYLLPVVAIVLGVLVLGESITVITLAGIALVLAGVALTRRRVKPASGEHRVE